MDFKDKVVLITGASSGLGAAIAVYMSQLSAKLVLVGRNKKNLEAVAQQCEKSKGIKALSVIADVSKEADVERIVNETINHFGKLHVLVNNAGVVELGGIKDTAALSKYDKIMSTNVRGVLQLTMLAVPHLIKTKGNIVNISSIVSTRAAPGMLAYCMSKAALDHFTKCIALDLAADGVRVNAVNPGLVKTNILNVAGFSDVEVDSLSKKVIETTPLGKLAEADDIAAMVAFLASDCAKSITGCTHPVDSGKSLV
ncbi:4-formylbenzenesulfonate dehydrogenase TsaC1/TsaC2-like [Zerene cesonia]|uniref:4-formylbenzenesulfonate dehydrogenase TsaC1/TsaC2-like n=1 Tax=Zerene cesonia TaxID=33412 RepID=UPI0018E54FE5|nr:4-formylbenzenesulfonate dehydrogenase TsaC1/TsaC2-like [Zerene cesonia]